jgi:hypothetical protein
MGRLTIFLARLIGLFAIAIVVAMFVRGPVLVESIIASSELLFFLAMISFGLGLAIVLAHNVWSGSALAVLVTIVGWLILVKGIVLLLLPASILSQALSAMQYSVRGAFYLLPALLIGLYLTWAGFASRADELED